MFFIIVGTVLFVYFGILLVRQIRAKQWKIARLSAVIVAIGLAGVITGFVMVSSSPGDADAEKITLQEYNRIEEGMTYKEVVEIVGASGKKSDLEGEKDDSISVYVFEGNGGSVSYAQLFFKDERVLIKSQLYLE